MADLDDIINGAIDDAVDSNVLPEPEADPGATPEEPTTEEPPTPEEEPPATEEPPASTEEPPATDPKTKDKPAAKPESDEDKALTKLLEEHGIKAPAAGQRENKIPYGRTRKIVGNAIKRAKEASAVEIKKHTDQIAAWTPELTNYRRVDELIAKDFPRYMGLLASLHPDAHKKYVEGLVPAAAAVKPASVPDEKDDPKPEPDVRYEDKSVGYSPEQHDKLLAWAGRKGAREALKTAESRFAPLEQRLTADQKREAATQQLTERRQAINEEIKTLRTHFGDLFTADEKLAEEGKSEIIAYQKANRCNLTHAALAVLLPKMSADRARMRTELMKELGQRKAAAKAAPVATKRPARAENEDRSVNDTINDALEAAGL